MPINWLTRMLPRLFRDWKGEQARYDEVGIVYGQFFSHLVIPEARND